MAKLDSWDNLFKFNKTLLDNDFNNGQRLVVNTSQPSENKVWVRLI
jgi:hypothetical protein